MIERESTNCGNNVSNALKVVDESGLKSQSVIIMQDSSMQLRMDAGFRKIWDHKNIELINFASYRVKLVVVQDELCFDDNNIEGLWNVERFINLQMGEIPRLSDTEEGYGPNGKNYIAHVDIPVDVQNAFDYLQKHYSASVREANEKYK